MKLLEYTRPVRQKDGVRRPVSVTLQLESDPYNFILSEVNSETGAQVWAIYPSSMTDVIRHVFDKIAKLSIQDSSNLKKMLTNIENYYSKIKDLLAVKEVEPQQPMTLEQVVSKLAIPKPFIVKLIKDGVVTSSKEGRSLVIPSDQLKVIQDAYTARRERKEPPKTTDILEEVKGILGTPKKRGPGRPKRK